MANSTDADCVLNQCMPQLVLLCCHEVHCCVATAWLAYNETDRQIPDIGPMHYAYHNRYGQLNKLKRLTNRFIRA